jgi:hypothetical protein
MIIGFAIAVISLYTGISLYEKKMVIDEEQQQFQYTSQTDFNLMNTSSDAIDYPALVENIQGNVMLKDYAIYLEELDGTYYCQVTLAHQETIPYPFVWGSDDLTEQNSVIVGREIEKSAIQKGNDKYLTINNQKYKITGVVGSERTEILDYMILLNYASLPDDEQERISRLDSSIVMVCSNSIDISESVRLIYDKMEQIENLYVTVGDSMEDEISVSSDVEKKIYYYLIYIFAMSICLIVSEFWIYQREEEISICKIYGLSNSDIVERYIKEFFIVMLSGMLVGIIVTNILLNRLVNGYHMSMNYMVILLSMVILSIMISFIIPVFHIYHNTPAGLVEEERG